MKTARQTSLFDADGVVDEGEAVAARARMRGMIERLRGAAVPFWRDECGVILDDGAFQRAMRLVPEAEARALWVEFDAEMERVYSIWAAAGGAGAMAGP